MHNFGINSFGVCLPSRTPNRKARGHQRRLRRGNAYEGAELLPDVLEVTGSRRVLSFTHLDKPYIILKKSEINHDGDIPKCTIFQMKSGIDRIRPTSVRSGGIVFVSGLHNSSFILMQIWR